MKAKLFITVIGLVAVGTALLMGSVLLTAGEDTKATQSSTDCQSVQPKACPAESVKACCEAKKAAGTCPAMENVEASPTNCVQSCCEAKKEAGTCPATKDKEACPAGPEKSRCGAK